FACSVLSSYSDAIVGAWDASCRFFFWRSALVMNLMNSSALFLCLEYVEMPKLCPPRLDLPGPSRPGSGATANLPLTLVPASPLARVYTYGQLRWKISLPAWKDARPSSSL